MEFDAAARLDFRDDAQVARMRERIAATRVDIEKFCSELKPGRKRSGGAARDRATVLAAARRVDLDLHEHITRIGERALDLQRAQGVRGAEAVIASINDIGHEREQEARRKALRGTVAFDRAETRSRPRDATRKEAAQW